MPTLSKIQLVITFVLIPFSVAFAGPQVVPHPKSKNNVLVWEHNFEVFFRFKEPTSIKIIQDAFLRAKKVGDTSSHLKKTTHFIDFSDRWQIDLKSGEIAVFSKTITNVYQLNDEDLNTLQKLILENFHSHTSKLNTLDK